MLVLLALACCGAPPIQAATANIPAARTLLVGPTRTLRLPSQAARIARDGDTVLIDPGDYDDCAVWRQSHLTIAARAPGVVFLGKTCQGKAIFVINGNDVTVRGISFTHAAVPDHNGAGIRAQGGNLTVINSRFIDNEEGILTSPGASVTVRIVHSVFRGNGTCLAGCAHGIYAGLIAELDVEDSRFTDTHEGHDIKSRAARTIIRGNDISDGPTGHASYLVDIPNGGNLLMEHNVLSKGPHTDNDTTAVEIGAEGVRHPTNSVVIRDNSFTNLLPKPTAFVTNHTQVPVELIDNRLHGKVVPLVGPGTVRAPP
ncbi:MAG TPA: right-handed parallel beta-helix repeat-containing protein [Acetobacteraceae bacterium]|jgi:hypothetical protein